MHLHTIFHTISTSFTSGCRRHKWTCLRSYDLAPDSAETLTISWDRQTIIIWETWRLPDNRWSRPFGWFRREGTFCANGSRSSAVESKAGRPRGDENGSDDHASRPDSAGRQARRTCPMCYLQRRGAYCWRCSRWRDRPSPLAQHAGSSPGGSQTESAGAPVAAQMALSAGFKDAFPVSWSCRHQPPQRCGSCRRRGWHRCRLLAD